MSLLRNTIHKALREDFPTCNLDRFEAITDRVVEAVRPMLTKAADNLDKLETAVERAHNLEPIVELMRGSDPALDNLNRLRLANNLPAMLRLGGDLNVHCDKCGAFAPRHFKGEQCDMCGEGTFQNPEVFAQC